MTVSQYITVFALVLTSYFGMMFTMRSKGPITALKIVIVLVCLFAFVGAFYIGAYWNHADFVCHVGQHCFPWGE